MGNLIAEAMAGRWPSFDLFKSREPEVLPRPTIRSVGSRFSKAHEYVVLELDHGTSWETEAEVFARPTGSIDSAWRSVGKTMSGFHEFKIAPRDTIDIAVQTRLGDLVSEFSQHVQHKSDAPLSGRELLEARWVELCRLVDQIEYPGFRYGITLSNDVMYLQITCDDVCNVTGERMTWKSGKWLLSEHMLDSEVVQKCLKATLTAIEHEAREKFKYRGRAIFDPHYDVDKLWELRGESDSVVRRDAPAAKSPAPPTGTPAHKIPEPVLFENSARALAQMPTKDEIWRFEPDELRSAEENASRQLRRLSGLAAELVRGILADIHLRMGQLGIRHRFDSDGTCVKGLTE